MVAAGSKAVGGLPLAADGHVMTGRELPVVTLDRLDP
jgi:hypothetical protein